MAEKYANGSSDCSLFQSDVYNMRKVTVDAFCKLDRNHSSMVCFLFNEHCGISDLYRALEQHSKLNFKLLIEILNQCEFVKEANSVQRELNKFEDIKERDENRYSDTREKLSKECDTVLTCKFYEFRIKLIEIQLSLSVEDLETAKEYFGLSNNEKMDYPMFIDLVKLAERKLLDQDNPYAVVKKIQNLLEETLGRSGGILKKLKNFSDLHCRYDKLSQIGNNMKIGTLKILTFLFNLNCEEARDWKTMLSEMKSERVFNIHLLKYFLQLCSEFTMAAELQEFAELFSITESDFAQREGVENSLSGQWGDLCRRSLEFRRLLVEFSLSDTFRDITDISERFDLPNHRALVCVSLLDIVLTKRELQSIDLYHTLENALEYCEFHSASVKLKEFYAKHAKLVDYCAKTNK